MIVAVLVLAFVLATLCAAVTAGRGSRDEVGGAHGDSCGDEEGDA